MPDLITNQARLKAGLCVRCGKVPPVPEKTMCVECRDTHNEYIRNRRKDRIAKGICQCCTEPVSQSSKQYCEEHRRVKLGPCNTCNSNEHLSGEHCQLGLCAKCGSPGVKAIEQTNYCLVHTKERLKTIAKKSKKIRDDRIAKGICMYGCGPIDPSRSGSRCIACLAKAVVCAVRYDKREREEKKRQLGEVV